jgi:hypothetical protein
MKKYDGKIIHTIYKTPLIVFHLLKIWAVITIPFWLLIKVYGDGLYEVTILDKNKKVLKLGYMWCTNEYRLRRRRKVRQDIRLRNKREFVLPPRYSIRFKKMDIIKTSNGYKPIIWTNPGFYLHDIPIFSEERIMINYPERIIDFLKIHPLQARMLLSLNTLLVELSLFDNNGQILSKAFIFAMSRRAAYKMLKDEMKEKGMEDLKERAKFIKLDFYKKETDHVIWSP